MERAQVREPRLSPVRVFQRQPKPHERVRLKNVGRLGEGETVKVVRNGEGGPKRCGKPRRGIEPGSGTSPRPPGAVRSCRRSLHVCGRTGPGPLCQGQGRGTGRIVRFGDGRQKAARPSKATTDSSAVGQWMAAERRMVPGTGRATLGSQKRRIRVRDAGTHPGGSVPGSVFSELRALEGRQTPEGCPGSVEQTSARR
jgi:hypothetical protein